MYTCFTTCLRFHFLRELNVGSRDVGFFLPTRVGRKGHTPQQCLQWAHLSCEHLRAIHPRWEECPQLKLGAPQRPCSYKPPSPHQPQAVPGPSDTRSPSGTSSRPCLHSTSSASPFSEREGTLLPAAETGTVLRPRGSALRPGPPAPFPAPTPTARARAHTRTHTHTEGTPFPCTVLSSSRPGTTPCPS